MKEEYVIGLDLGTTSAKAILFDLKGKVIAEAEQGYSLYYPYPGWVEQSPEEIERAAVSMIGRVVEESKIKTTQLLTIGISSAMHSIICVDQDGNPLSQAITWADARSNSQANLIRETVGESIYLQTGTPIHPMSPLLKLKWMKDQDYEPYKKANMFISIKEYLIRKWFGKKVVDYSVASASGLFDLRTLQWNDEALVVAGITRDQLSIPVPPTEVLEGLKPKVATEMGISNTIPFVIGASDGPLANLGIGAIHPGEVAITIGTSGAIRQFAAKPKTDSLQETFCYAFTENLSILGGPTNNGGIALSWLKKLLNQEDLSFDDLVHSANSVPPGANGLIFLPYLNGERAPIWNSNARGNFFGLTMQHEKEHLVRATMEGVIFSIYHVGEALERLAESPTKIYANGGFARSSLWLQILADVFNREVQVPISHQSSAWGAAWTALYGIGKVKNLESIKEHIPMRESFVPHSEHSQTYSDLFKLYKRLSDTLSPHFEDIASFQKKN